MKYFPNPAAFKRSFDVPKVVAEDHLKLATATQLRVLLYVCNSLTEDPSDGQIAAYLGLDEAEVQDALGYWKMAGLFVSKGADAPETKKTPKKVVAPRDNLPRPQQIAELGKSDPQIKSLLDEAELKFGRTLSQNEMGIITWFYTDAGLDISVILMLLEYAKQQNKLNTSYIKRLGAEWVNDGIDTLEAVDGYIKLAALKQSAWGVVRSTFGIEPRIASSKELQNSHLWLNEWGFNREMLKAAYDICVDTTSVFSMNYVAGILKKWHEKGVKTLEDIEKIDKQHEKEKEAAKPNMVTYDIGEIERRLKLKQEEE